MHRVVALAPFLVACSGTAAPTTNPAMSATGTLAAPSASTTQIAPGMRAIAIAHQLPYSVGNMTFTPDGRTIFSHHPFFEPEIRVAELDDTEAGLRPFPNRAWNTPQTGSDEYLDSVLGVRADEYGIVWMLDMGLRTNITPKLVGWDTREDRLEAIYRIPEPASLPTSQHNDFIVDTKHSAFYIADEGIGRGGDGTLAALVVVDMKTGVARRLLQGHESTLPEDVPIVIEGQPLTVPGPDGTRTVIKVGADGIAADSDFEWLYYGPLNGGWIYRVPTRALRDASLSPDELAARVERYAEKPNNGGLSIDRDDNLYLTEVEHNAVGVIPAATRRYMRLVSHPELSWPDGVSYAPDGFMYVSAAQVNRAAVFHGDKGSNKAPYLVFRFRPLAPGRIGH